MEKWPLIVILFYKEKIIFLFYLLFYCPLLLPKRLKIFFIMLEMKNELVLQENWARDPHLTKQSQERVLWDLVYKGGFPSLPLKGVER